MSSLEDERCDEQLGTNDSIYYNQSCQLIQQLIGANVNLTSIRSNATGPAEEFFE
jgi:hypothetical protein